MEGHFCKTCFGLVGAFCLSVLEGCLSGSGGGKLTLPTHLPQLSWSAGSLLRLLFQLQEERVGVELSVESCIELRALQERGVEHVAALIRWEKLACPST